MRTYIKENKNLIVFLICSVISTAIWLSMSLSRTYTKAFDTKIVFTNIPIDKNLTVDTLNLKTTIEAKGWDLFFKNTDEKVISIDLSKYKNKQLIEFSNLKTLIQENQTNLKIVDINPSSFRLDYTKLSSKKVPIKLSLEKNFPPNYYFLNHPKIEPDSVIISSDEKTLKEINFVESEKISISEKDVFLSGLKIAKSKKYRIDTESFNVKFDTKEFVEKEFLVEVNIDNNNDGAELIIFPEQVKLKCLVPISIYESISALDFYISADFNNIEVQKNNKLLLSVKEKPEGVRNIQLQKDKVEFIIYQ